jgi:hypothetical protein
MASTYLNNTHYFIMFNLLEILALRTVSVPPSPNQNISIKAVKEPWWRSSRFNALSQMLLTNQRLDKLAAARVDFSQCGMLQGTSFDWLLSRLSASPYYN